MLDHVYWNKTHDFVLANSPACENLKDIEVKTKFSSKKDRKLLLSVHFAAIARKSDIYKLMRNREINKVKRAERMEASVLSGLSSKELRITLTWRYLCLGLHRVYVLGLGCRWGSVYRNRRSRFGHRFCHFTGCPFSCNGTNFNLSTSLLHLNNPWYITSTKHLRLE